MRRKPLTPFGNLLSLDAAFARDLTGDGRTRVRLRPLVLVVAAAYPHRHMLIPPFDEIALIAGLLIDGGAPWSGVGLRATRFS
jgi:hypothetical protein